MTTAIRTKPRQQATGDVFGIQNNPKANKGDVLGVWTAMQYMTPSDGSGRNACKYASAGCRKVCLNTSGKGGMKVIQDARLRKINRFFDDNDAHMTQAAKEIARLDIEATAAGYKAAVRPNATTDFPFERIPVTYEGVRYPSLMAAFPNVQFYDYTKYPISERNPAANYHLTFSLSEREDAEYSSEEHARDALAAGVNVAVVFDLKRRGGKLPATYTIGGRRGSLVERLLFKPAITVPVIDGDISDVRFMDPKGVIVGLKAKGDARGSRSRFVR